MLYLFESNLYSMNNYGDRLAEALRIAQMERQELADGINVSVQAIGQVIVGKTKALTAENSALAARFLGVDSFWLATGIGSPRGNTDATGRRWPFSVEIELVLTLPQDELDRLDKLITFTVTDWHSQQNVKSQKAS